MIFGKNDRALLCGYYDLLHGADDGDLSENLSQSDINILHKFHTNAVAGVQFADLLSPDKYRKPLRRAMFQMFECWQRGKPIPEPEPEKYYYHHNHHSLTVAFSARLNGATDNELRRMGLSSADINKLNKFLMYVDHDMTIRDRMRKTGVGEYSARAMLKLYQEKQAGIT